MSRSRKQSQHNRGFTLIELLVCIFIFMIMTALMIVKYGNFNQSVLLTNLVYDTALAIRTAQNYGLSVKTAKNASGSLEFCGETVNFQCAYGVAFNSEPGQNDHFDLFAIAISDTESVYKASKRNLISTYTLKRGATISGVCKGDNSCIPGLGQLYVTFKRPDPNADIFLVIGGDHSYPIDYAKIAIKGTDNTTRSISVRSNGQISVDI